MIKWPTGKGDLRRRLWKLVHPTQRDQQRIQMPEPYADCTAVLKFRLDEFIMVTPILRNHTKPDEHGYPNFEKPYETSKKPPNTTKKKTWLKDRFISGWFSGRWVHLGAGLSDFWRQQGASGGRTGLFGVHVSAGLVWRCEKMPGHQLRNQCTFSKSIGYGGTNRFFKIYSLQGYEQNIPHDHTVFGPNFVKSFVLRWKPLHRTVTWSLTQLGMLAV